MIQHVPDEFGRLELPVIKGSVMLCNDPVDVHILYAQFNPSSEAGQDFWSHQCKCSIHANEQGFTVSMLKYAETWQQLQNVSRL